MKDVDVLIIGAGMSGLAAGIRSAMYDRRVMIAEQHVLPGGLNSYYRRDGRWLDVGLHAVTNFARPGDKGRPLLKILKQLRFRHEDLNLIPQRESWIDFPDRRLRMTNDVADLMASIATHFPQDLDGFLALKDEVIAYEATRLSHEYSSARERIQHFIQNPDLIERILCPLLIYGSAWERDMDFAQFCIMFQSIFLEGFSRPEGGVRPWLEKLTSRFRELGGELAFGTRVRSLDVQNGRVVGAWLDQKGRESYVKVSTVLSSAGLPETMSLLGEEEKNVGKMAFLEAIFVVDDAAILESTPASIVFANLRGRYPYECPSTRINTTNAVVCFPGHFGPNPVSQGEGMARITFMANFAEWKALSQEAYREAKEEARDEALRFLERYCPSIRSHVIAHDVFSPLTVERFTGRRGGAVYGSTDKHRDGRTHIDGLTLCGTDQGFLGIIGAMLSGISMANLHVLQGNA